MRINLQVKLTFLGRAGNVTGSKYILGANNVRLLVDEIGHLELQGALSRPLN